MKGKWHARQGSRENATGKGGWRGRFVFQTVANFNQGVGLRLRLRLLGKEGGKCDWKMVQMMNRTSEAWIKK